MDITLVVLLVIIAAAAGFGLAWLLLSGRSGEGRALVAEAQREAAEARADAARSAAELAVVKGDLGRAEGERDAARARVAEVVADRETLVREFKALSTEALERQGQQAEATAKQRLQATEQVMTPVKESLTALQQRLIEVEKERMTMAADLRNQIEQVRQAGAEVRQETRTLVNALRKPQQRGAWGELQLKRVAEVAGMVEHCDFALQSTMQADEKSQRPDMTVHLGDGKFVFVDSKVPLSAFLDMADPDDEAALEQAYATFARHVRTHIDQLGAKDYFAADAGTPDFVILFVPNDALYVEALAQLPDLYDYAGKRNIVLASPTSLIATLRATAYGWKQARLAESAREISQLGKDLYERLSGMGTHVGNVGRHLHNAVKAYNDAVGSLERRVMVSARRFRDLQVSEADLTSPQVVEEPLRELTAPEFLEAQAAAPEVHFLTRLEHDVEALVDLATPESSPRRGVTGAAS